MIKSISTAALLFGFVSVSFADISIEPIPVTIQKTGEVVNSDLPENEAVFVFTFSGLYDSDSSATVKYEIDGTTLISTLNQAELRIVTTPGVHSFLFLIGSSTVGLQYNSVTADSLEIARKIEASYRVNLTTIVSNIEIVTKIDLKQRIEVRVCKPVIYLYPESTTEVIVEVDIHGERPFFYPEYQHNWSVIAHPNGDLEIDDASFRYLFWEADDTDHLSEIALNEGFIVEGKDALSFLETHLRTFGFTAAERADFITFWGPRMAANDHNLVRFEWNDVCDKFADLNISPAPDNLYRFYIFMSAISDVDIDIQPQILPTMSRNGFTVLEWGGQISNYQPNSSL